MWKYIFTKHTQQQSPLSEQLYALLEVFPDAFFFQGWRGSLADHQ